MLNPEPAIYRDCSGFNWVPPTPYSKVDQIGVTPETFAPLSVRERFFAYSDESIFSRVVVLFLDSRPSTIFRTISKINISPIKRLTNGGFSHVCKKRLKGLFPLSTHGNTPLPVEIELRASRVFTSLLHSGPYGVRTAFRHTVGFRSLSCSFGRETPARNSVATFKMPSGNDLFLPAITKTHPYSPAFSVVNNSADDYEFPKPLPRYVNNWTHITSYLKLCHNFTKRTISQISSERRKHMKQNCLSRLLHRIEDAEQDGTAVTLEVV